MPEIKARTAASCSDLELGLVADVEMQRHAPLCDTDDQEQQGRGGGQHLRDGLKVKHQRKPQRGQNHRLSPETRNLEAKIFLEAEAAEGDEGPTQTEHAKAEHIADQTAPRRGLQKQPEGLHINVQAAGAHGRRHVAGLERGKSRLRFPRQKQDGRNSENESKPVGNDGEIVEPVHFGLDVRICQFLLPSRVRRFNGANCAV